MNVLPAGALALEVSISASDDRLKWYSNRRGRPVIGMLACIVTMIPSVFVGRLIEVDHFIEEEKLFEMYGFIDTACAFANGFAVSVLILITGFASYGLGCINAKLEHLNGDGSGNPLLLRATPPDGPRTSL